MPHLCEQLVEAAHYLKSEKMSSDQLSQLHHFSLRGGKVYFKLVYGYFGTNKNLQENNINFAERVKFVASRHKESGQAFNDLIEQALKKCPL
jgi:hypothetical protein